ncbi:MAG: hypothetical protein ABI670_02275 [Chloroflexota bacterium]
MDELENKTDAVDYVPDTTSEKSSAYPSIEFQRVIPFSDYVSLNPPSSIGPSYLTADLAAAFTTTIDNPVFKLPTIQQERDGAIPAAFAMYAPYYVGTGLTPEQIANDVAGQAAAFLKSLDAAHGYDGYVGRMLSVLRGGHVTHHGLQAIEDRNILYDVNDFLAAITNRLHHIARLSVTGDAPHSEAELYRAGTHERVDPYASTVVYALTPKGYDRTFKLPQFIRSDPTQLVALGWDFFDTKALRRGAEFAALAAGKLGDPLVRSVLAEQYLPAHMRSREYLQASR